jgi:hypothetical protein
MIAGNLVEIKLPKIQSRKCLRKFNFNEIRSPELSAYHLPQPKEFFPSTMSEIFSSVLAYRIFDLLLVVGVGDKLILCSKFFISSIPLFRSKSGPVENCSGPVDFWCSLVKDQCTFGKLFNPCAMVGVLLAFSSQVQCGFKPWWDQTKYFIFVAFPLSRRSQNVF